MCVCVCVCTGVWPCECVCGVGVTERKPGRVPACVEKNWTMDTKFNAFTISLFVFVCLFVCSIPFYKYIVLKLVYLSM